MVGIPGLLKASSAEKKGVYLIHDEPPAQRVAASPVRVIRYPDSAKSCAAIVAYIELIIGPTSLILFGDLNWVKYLDQLMTPAGIPSDDLPVVSAIGALILRYFSAVLLFFGVVKNKPSWAAPYLMIEIFLMFAGPFAFLYSMSGSEPGVYENVGWVTLIPFLFISIWFEYFKWRCVYSFYDTRTTRHDKSEFASFIKKSGSDTNE
ncbi:unnamed protein product, partial [Nesidiocoris tenuis]